MYKQVIIRRKSRDTERQMLSYLPRTVPGASQTPRNCYYSQVAHIFSSQSTPGTFKVALLILFSRYIISLQVGLQGNKFKPSEKEVVVTYTSFFLVPCVIETERHLAFNCWVPESQYTRLFIWLSLFEVLQQCPGNIVFYFKMEQIYLVSGRVLPKSKILEPRSKAIATASDTLAPTLRCRSAKRNTRLWALGSLRPVKQAKCVCMH